MLAANLHPSTLNQLAALRATPGIEAARHNDTIWIRSTDATTIRALPHLELAHLDTDHRLTRPGETIPYRRLPSDLFWQPLHHFITVPKPTSIFPGQVIEAPASIRVVPDQHWRPTPLLLTTIQHLRQLAESLSRPQLAQFEFALSQTGDALLRADPPAPPPDLPGRYYTLEHGIALPAGHRWEPPLPASVIAASFNLQKNQIALFLPGEQTEPWTLLSANDWVRASRSAIRLSHDPVKWDRWDRREHKA